jgi:hypothetical protein
MPRFKVHGILGTGHCLVGPRKVWMVFWEPRLLMGRLALRNGADTQHHGYGLTMWSSLDPMSKVHICKGSMIP